MNENVKIRVEMVGENESTATRVYKQTIHKFVPLGREIKISPKANATICIPGYKQEMLVESVTVLIGIGKDHTADLIMTKDAWEALNRGEEISITTTKEFKKRYL